MSAGDSTVRAPYTRPEPGSPARAARLPGVLAEIAALAGEAAALKLAARYGGIRVYIPARVHEDHWLVACVGWEAAQKIAAHFSADGRGTHVVLPLGPCASYGQFRRTIAERIDKLDRERRTAREIARMVGVTQRAVHRNRAKRRGKGSGGGRQGSLF